MKYYEGCQEEAREKTVAFREKQNMDFEFKKEYAARRAWEFYNHPEVAGRCYVAVGGLDSITLFLFLRSIGINVPGTSVSMLEDRSIQIIHKALGIKALYLLRIQTPNARLARLKLSGSSASLFCRKKPPRRSAIYSTQRRRTKPSATLL